MSDDPAEPNNADGREKALAILREFLGECVSRLSGAHCPSDTAAVIAGALATSADDRRAKDIGFHLTDWASDAAFIVALQLFPERFTAEEIADGVEDFLIHAPNHVAAAAVLSGHPPEDIFGVVRPE